jgi:photosystem II stability/assembly factor-like uncharacterized protein
MTPWPTLTPLATQPPNIEYRDDSPAIQGSTHPANLTLSRESETVVNVSYSAGSTIGVATWKRDGQTYVTVQGPFGWQTQALPNVGSAVDVASSPRGRLYAIGNSGSLSYSDDHGRTWTEPISVLPGGSAPRMTVADDGQLWAFIQSGGSVQAARWTGGSWSAPSTVAAANGAYDVALTNAGDLLVASDGGQVFFNGSRVASLGGGRTTVVARGNRVVAGSGDGPAATVAWSDDGGRSWSAPCTVQENTVDWSADPSQGDVPGDATALVGTVYGIPTTQDKIAVLYVWQEPGVAGGSRPMIATGGLTWGRCDPSPPADAGMVLRLQFCGLPGLYDVRAPQSDFRIALDGGEGMIAFTGLQWNGGSDVYAALLSADTILSAPQGIVELD